MTVLALVVLSVILAASLLLNLMVFALPADEAEDRDRLSFLVYANKELERRLTTCKEALREVGLDPSKVRALLNRPTLTKYRRKIVEIEKQ